MSVDSITEPTAVMQSTQSIANTNSIVSENMMGVRIIGLMQSLCYLLIIAGLIVGIIYMIKSKKTKWKRIFIGVIIIVVPFILYWILNIVQFNMSLNM